MNTHASQHSMLFPLSRAGLWLEAGAQALRAFAARTDAWLALRRRAADDLEVLARMSDRELQDIGIGRASIGAIASTDWTRDFPH
jgi:uncharacterized protein YjiS (DUF1127 family)